MRTLRQDMARTQILEGLQANEVYIQIDWVMKFLPLSGHVPKMEWFGQRGMPWHISHVIARDNTGRSYRTRLYIHVFDTVAQDSPAVIAILHSVLKQIKRELPHITCDCTCDWTMLVVTIVHKRLLQCKKHLLVQL